MKYYGKWCDLTKFTAIAWDSDRALEIDTLVVHAKSVISTLDLYCHTSTVKISEITHTRPLESVHNA